MRNIHGALVLLILCAFGAQAEVSEVYDFDTRAEEQRYQNLIAELRCLLNHVFGGQGLLALLQPLLSF